MIVYILLLLVTAFVAYILGSMRTRVIASQFIFHKNLMRLGRGNVWISNFRRVYGIKGFLVLLLTEMARDAIAIAFGMLLLSFKGHATVGAAFAGFCLVMGCLWPLFYNLRGGSGILPLAMTGLFVSPEVGLAVAGVGAAVLLFSRYISLSGLISGIIMIVVSVLMVDDNLTMTVCILASAAVIVHNIPGVRRIFRGTEVRLSTEQDLSYKFDS